MAYLRFTPFSYRIILFNDPPSLVEVCTLQVLFILKNINIPMEVNFYSFGFKFLTKYFLDLHMEKQFKSNNL